MSLIVVGLNHRTVPVELLERMAVSERQLPKVLHDLADREHVLEVAVLSTCNRTEIYAYCTRFHAAVADIMNFLGEYSGASPSEFNEHLYTYYDDAAVSHMFAVASGLDSMIVGEGEILRQVRDAWQHATGEETVGTLLANAFRRAVEAGKRVRTETEISRHPVSIASTAVSVASEHLGGLESCRAMVVGAGEMGQGVATALAHRGLDELCIANRSVSRAEALAETVGARAVGLDRLTAELDVVDVVLTSTASAEILLDRTSVEQAMAGRDRPLLVVDIALPRDVDPGVGEIPNVTLLDLDDLKDFAQRSTARRRADITRAREIVANEVDRFRDERRARLVAPVVRALREHGDGIREAELARFASRFAHLDDATKASVEHLANSIVAKLLHEPTARLKDAAGSDRGDLLADAVTTLFALEPGDAGDAR